MAPRVGLQARMAISYVLATVAIVAFVEALAGTVVLPRVFGGSDVTVKALDAAESLAGKLGTTAANTGRLGAGIDLTSPADIKELGLPLSIRPRSAPLPPGHLESMALILDTQGRILSTTDPFGYPDGARASQLLPPDAASDVQIGLPPNPKLAGAAVGIGPDKKTVWALAAVRVSSPAYTATGKIETSPKVGGQTSATASGKTEPRGGGDTGRVGYVYVQAPATTGFVLPHRLPLAVLVLLLTVPVGVVFGLLTTRNLRRRLRRLAEASQAVATGDFVTRLTPASSDEVGQLERNFNDMTDRLNEATARELQLASQNARLAERSRISRELHDSISQHLFSLTLLSGGLQRALPADSPLQPQVGRLSDTVATAIHEMRALVLDLHPSALADKGLGPALEDLCASYRARLGLEVNAQVEPVQLDASGQHAILRVAQEAMANAARHGDPATVRLELRAVADGVVLEVADDGRGFDTNPASAPPGGVGLRLMRERVAELGGELTVDSRPGNGTTVRALLPAPVEAPQSATTGAAP
jgi:signal transduction histidine kinase